MSPRRTPTKPFRSAKTEVEEQTKSDAYKLKRQLAFMDQDFLLRRELRPIRLLLEHTKPEIILREERIVSTIVIFGSARIIDPETAKKQLTVAKRRHREHPENPLTQQALKLAEKLVEKSVYYDEARRLAQIISIACQRPKRRHFVIITGGGPGIMEAANRGAHEVNCKSIGLNILLPFEQGANPYISPELSFHFHYFAMRKMHFLIRARALIAFPGGYGTLDELFEALTLLQTKKIRPIPVLLFGKKYWDRIINFDNLVEEAMISPEDLNFFKFVDTAEEAWQAIIDFYNLTPDTLSEQL